MKTLFLSLFVAAFAAVAQEQKPQPPQKPQVDTELRKKLVAKYDENKDGVLSMDERQKVTPEDRKLFRQAGLGKPRGGKPPGDRPPGDKPPGPKPPRAPHTKE